jgi:hypothetical protein
MKKLSVLTTNPEKQVQARAAFAESGIEVDFLTGFTVHVNPFVADISVRTLQ